MTTWNEIFPDVNGEPVRGDVDQFNRMSTYMFAVHDRADQLRDQFHSVVVERIQSTFSGEAANAFAGLVGDTDRGLKDVPTVSSGIATTLKNHALRLAELRSAADQALARAATNWSDLRHAEALHSENRRNYASIVSQIRQLQSSSDPAATARVASLSAESQSLNWEVRRINGAVDDASHRLSSSRSQYDSLHDAWVALDKSTGDALQHQPLWSLGDPSNLSKAGHAVAGFVSHEADALVHFVDKFIADVAELVEAVLARDLDRFLFALRDVIDDVLKIVNAAMLVVALIAAVASGGALIPAFLGALALYTTNTLEARMVAETTRLLIGVYLVSKGAIDPRTGQPLSRNDLFVEGLTVGLDLAAGRSIERIRTAGNKETEDLLQRKLLSGDTTLKGQTWSAQRLGFPANTPEELQTAKETVQAGRIADFGFLPWHLNIVLNPGTVKSAADGYSASVDAKANVPADRLNAIKAQIDKMRVNVNTPGSPRVPVLVSAAQY